MAIINGNFQSEKLRKATNYTAIFPDDLTQELSVVYLLHGRSADEMSSLLNTNLHMYVRNLSMVVFCVSVGNSYYENSEVLGDTFDYVKEEFKNIVEKIHPFKKQKEFIMGFSMGAYGVLKLLESGEIYDGVSLISPLINLRTLTRAIPESKNEVEAIIGNDWSDKNNNFMRSLSQLKIESPVIHLCGYDDFMYEDSKKMASIVHENMKNYIFIDDFGRHDWFYWDRAFKETLTYFQNIIDKGEKDNGRNDF